MGSSVQQPGCDTARVSCEGLAVAHAGTARPVQYLDKPLNLLIYRQVNRPVSTRTAIASPTLHDHL
jgi:hypothetical protein